VGDLEKARLLVFTPTSIREWPLRADGSRRPIEIRSAAPDQRLEVDDAGAVYYVVRSLDTAGTGDGRHVRMPIVREHLTSERIDTVAFYRRAVTSHVIRSPGSVTSVGLYKFRPSDAWGVDRSGAIWIIRSPEYMVETIGRDGSLTVGPVVPYGRRAPAESDKTDLAITVRALGLTPPAIPKVVPPINNQHGIVWIAPNGRVWVQEMATVEEARTRLGPYHVIDVERGTVTRVRFPERSRLLGFHDDALYVSRRDSLDLLHIQRYRLSRILPR
jgi:hypothetical protein